LLNLKITLLKMSEALNVNVLVSAKEEYTQQLCYVLSPLIYQGIQAVFEDSKKLPKKIKGISYRNFQIALINVQNWSQFVIEKETKRIKRECAYLSDLVTAIFVSHVKILACVRLKGEHKNIKLKIPSMDTFIHKIYILVAQKFYNKVHLIHEADEVIIALISNIINECIRKQLPIEHILSEYLYDVFNEDEEPEKEDSVDREINGDDIAEEESVHSDTDESEFDDTTKTIPTVPINQPPARAASPEPNFEDSTKIEMPDSNMNTPVFNPDVSNIDAVPRHDLEPPVVPPPSPSPPVHMEESRPSSPITLFGDAKEYNN
jgi:hypothetical protein